MYYDRDFSEDDDYLVIIFIVLDNPVIGAIEVVHFSVVIQAEHLHFYLLFHIYNI